MNRYLAPVLGLVLAFGLFGVDVSLAANAGLNDDADNPSVIAGSTVWGGSARSAVLTVINFFLFFLGILATAMIIYGGYLYMTSAGDDQKVESAKKILMYAAIGIIVVLLSFALVNTLTNLGGGARAET